jgi:hypothetical protein
MKDLLELESIAAEPGGMCTQRKGRAEARPLQKLRNPKSA